MPFPARLAIATSNPHKLRELARICRDWPVERLTLRGALNLDEPAVTGHDDVHVGLGPNVFLVTQIQHRFAVDHTDRDRCYGTAPDIA